MSHKSSLCVNELTFCSPTQVKLAIALEGYQEDPGPQNVPFCLISGN